MRRRLIRWLAGAAVGTVAGSCLAAVVAAPQAAASAPAGWSPASLASAYGFPVTSGAGRTVAVVTAYDDPAAEADLGVYRTQIHRR